jgi:tRNA nucleotidyltransferase (CCA-adding enzyme)
VRDIDLVVQGNAHRFASALAKDLGVPVRLHDRFGTATLDLADGSALDVAMARRETYERPGALPRVSPAKCLEEDLFRRDFTINAMALEIAPGRISRLHDPFGGRADLARKHLAILHPNSFRDDPTRAFRAVRYANRLGFSVEAKTRRAMREAVRQRLFDEVSGQRIRRELEKLFSEPNRAGALHWLARLGLSEAFHSSPAVGSGTLSRMRKAERAARGSEGKIGWLAYLLVWAADSTGWQAKTLADRLSLAGTDRRILISWPATLQRLGTLPQPLSPSAVAAIRLSSEERLAASAVLSGSAGRALLLAALRGKVTLAIGGRDLVRAGLAPGPQIGRALTRTLDARRDGMISREEELEFALRVAGKTKP